MTLWAEAPGYRGRVQKGDPRKAAPLPAPVPVHTCRITVPDPQVCPSLGELTVRVGSPMPSPTAQLTYPHPGPQCLGSFLTLRPQGLCICRVLRLAHSSALPPWAPRVWPAPLGVTGVGVGLHAGWMGPAREGELGANGWGVGVEGAASGVWGPLLQNAIPRHMEALTLVEALPESVLRPPVRGGLPTLGMGAHLSPKVKGPPEKPQ